MGQHLDPNEHPDYQAHADSTEGHWYLPECRTDAPAEVKRAYYASHPVVFIEPGQPAPVEDTTVDPAVLARAAYEAMELPVGTIRWNPSLQGSGATVVGMDTWVWVEDAPTSVSVRAEIPGLWAQVDAVMSGLRVSAPGADPVRCPDTGTAWVTGASSTTCAISFFRSTANQPLKAGQSQPTATLTATATWTASWTSSLDAAPTTLPTQTLTTTGEIPVAEVQTLVTHG